VILLERCTTSHTTPARACVLLAVHELHTHQVNCEQQPELCDTLEINFYPQVFLVAEPCQLLHCHSFCVLCLPVLMHTARGILGSFASIHELVCITTGEELLHAPGRCSDSAAERDSAGRLTLLQTVSVRAHTASLDAATSNAITITTTTTTTTTTITTTRCLLKHSVTRCLLALAGDGANSEHGVIQ